MPVPLGSFDVIIVMDWLTKYNGVIICDEKIVTVSFQEYLSRGCDIFLAQITIKEAKDESEGKRLEDAPTVRDFSEVFPEDLPGFSKIAKPMTKLTQKNVKFDWGEKEEAAFQLITQKLCSAPILAFA
ncbi:hypothetical protein Tco_1218426 [Tanacetum coccineum]